MKSKAELINEINRKVHEVLYRGYTRAEITALIPVEDFNLLSINDHITYNDITFFKDGTAVVTVVGVIVKPVSGIDEVYVCL